MVAIPDDLKKIIESLSDKEAIVDILRSGVADQIAIRTGTTDLGKSAYLFIDNVDQSALRKILFVLAVSMTSCPKEIGTQSSPGADLIKKIEGCLGVSTQSASSVASELVHCSHQSFPQKKGMLSQVMQFLLFYHKGTGILNSHKNLVSIDCSQDDKAEQLVQCYLKALDLIVVVCNAHKGDMTVHFKAMGNHILTTSVLHRDLTRMVIVNVGHQEYLDPALTVVRQYLDKEISITNKVGNHNDMRIFMRFAAPFSFQKDTSEFRAISK